MAMYTSGVSSSVWQRGKKDVAAGLTVTIDDVSLTAFRGIKYIFGVYNKTKDKTKLFDMNLIQENGIIKENIFGKIGSNISYSINTSVVLGFLKVDFTNNEAYNLVVELVKVHYN